MVTSKLDNLTKLLWYNNSKMSDLSNTWNDYDNSLVTKTNEELTWYDKATLNLNPNLKDRRSQYQSLVTQTNDLKSQLTNLQSAQSYLQNSINQQKTSVNKMYDLQNMANRLSAEISWWGRSAWWLWAWAWQISQARAQIDNQAYSNMLNNESQRQWALSNIANQQMQLPTTLSSMAMNNANIRWSDAQAEANMATAEYTRKQASLLWKNMWWWSSNKSQQHWEEHSEENLQTIIRWMIDKGTSINDINRYLEANGSSLKVRRDPTSSAISLIDNKQMIEYAI